MISRNRVFEAVQDAADLDPRVLTDMIARAVGFVEGQTRRYFGLPIQVTEYLSGDGTRLLRLSEPAVVIAPAVTAIVLVEERADPGDDATVLGVTDYTLRIRNGTPPRADTIAILVRSGSVWTHGYEYAVTYGRGYALDAGPKDIEQIILGLVEQKVAGLGDELMQSETVGSYSYTRFKDSNVDLIDDGWQTINAWRRAVFA